MDCWLFQNVTELKHQDQDQNQKLKYLEAPQLSV